MVETMLPASDISVNGSPADLEQVLHIMLLQKFINSNIQIARCTPGEGRKVLVTFNDNRPSDIMKTKSKISTGMSGIEAIEYLTREIQRNKIRGLASNDIGEKLFFKRRMLIEERKLRGLLALTGAGRFGKKSFAINSIVEYR